MASAVDITSSNSIQIQIGGNTVAGVQSYSVKYNRDVKEIESFGTDIPIGYIKGRKKYTLELNRVWLEDTAINDGIDFHTLADSIFNVLITKNGKSICYTDCTVTDITEDGSLNDAVKEKLTCTAKNRMKSE